MTDEVDIRSRRFIAGARCPQCNAQDRIQRVEKVSGEVLMRCVACGVMRNLDTANAEGDTPGPATEPVQWRNRGDKP